MNGHDNILCYYILLQLKTFSNFIPNNNNNVDDFVKSEEIKKNNVALLYVANMKICLDLLIDWQELMRFF